MLIELNEIDKSYHDRQGQPVAVLKQLSLGVEQGAFLALAGASGCGKSTLLNILGCLDRLDSGEYRFDGQNVGPWSEGQRADLRNRRIGFVFQAFHLLPFLTVEANIALPFMYNHHGQRPSHEQIESLLKSVDLEGMSQRLPGELSGGQMQRVAIARALVLGAELILADEPTGNLDSAVAQGVLDLFEQLVQQGKTVVFVTHDPAISARAYRQIKMDAGKIVSDEHRESTGGAV
ncbi:MAG: ABC transporter ATP-binding protein [Planctomycetaceae bacterium]